MRLFARAIFGSDDANATTDDRRIQTQRKPTLGQQHRYLANEPETSEEASRRLGVTKERARQIETRATEILREALARVLDDKD